MKMKKIEPLETIEDIEKMFHRSGRATPTPRRMAHWRRIGLLKPVRQSSVKGVRGSITLYPGGTGRQALEIDWLLDQTGKLADVGWLLWWHGRSVEGRWWRPILTDAASQLYLGLSQLRNLADADDDAEDDTVFDKVAATKIHGSPLGLVAQRLKSTDGFATFLRLVSDVGSGSFEGFGDLSDPDALKDFEIAQKGFGFHQARRHRVGGIGTQYADVLPDALEKICQALSIGDLRQTLASAKASELSRQRDYLRDASLVGVALHDAHKATLGPNALGLKLLSLYQREPAKTQALVLVSFIHFRRHSNFEMYKHAEVKQLLRGARR